MQDYQDVDILLVEDNDGDILLAREAFGESLDVFDDEPGFGMRMGSTVVMAYVRPWGDDAAWLQSYSPVVKGADINGDLALYLLKKNEGMRFGAFGLADDGTIFFNYSVIADTVDKEEFKACILAVAQTADDLDDEIVKRWGGQRVADLRA